MFCATNLAHLLQNDLRSSESNMIFSSVVAAAPTVACNRAWAYESRAA